MHSVRFAALAIALGLIAVLRPATAQTLWSAEAYNPQPAELDLVLPMPCGGAMVFRRVDVPGDGWIDDRRVLLGGDELLLAYAEMPRYDHIAAPFADPDNPARRHFWIGAYEVTEDQMAALSPGCPEPTMAGRLPAAGIGWFDAVAFAQMYSEWLHANAPAALPLADGISGFLRLPTEAEWEFAARGGVAVSPEAFRERVFPMEDAMQTYVWFQGNLSSSGDRHPIGLLNPNPLGLHDMLGNVEEVVLEPFRLNRLGRLHGLPGGYVVKGGSFRTPRDRIRSAMRRELPPFVSGRPNRPDSAGFRLVIAAPALTSLQRVDQVRAELDALGQASNAPGPEEATIGDVLAELARIAGETRSAELEVRLEGMAVALRRDLERRTADAARTGNSLIRLGAYLGSMIRSDSATVSLRRRISDAFERADSDPDLRSRALSSLELAETAVETNFEFYVSNVIVAAETFETEILRGQLAILQVELAERDQSPLIPLSNLFVGHAADFRRNGQVDREAWLADLAGTGQ